MNSVVFPPDPDKIEIKLKALCARQPIGDLYISSVPSDEIQKITFFDVRRVIQQERDVERYLGIQRPLNEGILAELYRYVNFKDATFPTSIIVALDDEYCSYDREKSEILI